MAGVLPSACYRHPIGMTGGDSLDTSPAPGWMPPGPPIPYHRSTDAEAPRPAGLTTYCQPTHGALPTLCVLDGSAAWRYGSHAWWAIVGDRGCSQPCGLCRERSRSALGTACVRRAQRPAGPAMRCVAFQCRPSQGIVVRASALSLHLAAFEQMLFDQPDHAHTEVGPVQCAGQWHGLAIHVGGNEQHRQHVQAAAPCRLQRQ
ncbi:hypothetical protein XCM_0355 [Xanthomonas citri pv. mangiferaeindicae]|nr:hypothetical protein XCM_0355 [Xanthomonas citri pv. mangiferaeindicae]